MCLEPLLYLDCTAAVLCRDNIVLAHRALPSHLYENGLLSQTVRFKSVLNYIYIFFLNIINEIKNKITVTYRR